MADEPLLLTYCPVEASDVPDLSGVTRIYSVRPRDGAAVLRDEDGAWIPRVGDEIVTTVVELGEHLSTDFIAQ